jgi:hypothetical protein
MSRTNFLAPRLIALCLAAAAVALAGSVAMPAAGAPEKPKLDKPALLWKSYPLNPQPRTAEQVAPVRHAPVRHEAIERTTGADTGLRNLVLAAALLVMLLGVSTLVFTRRPAAARMGVALRVPARIGVALRAPARISVALQAPARIGVALGGRVRAARPGRASRHRPKRKPRPARAQPPRREVIPHLVAAPAPAPTQAGEPERSDDLLEALQPKAPQVAPPPDRPELQKEVETRPEPVEADPKPARAADRPAHTRTQTQPVHARLQIAREEPAILGACEIRLWRGFVKCQLYATDIASGAVLAESPYFRQRDEDVPGPNAEKALSALLAELELRGWHVESDGPSWYQRRLQLFEQDPDEPLPPLS